jgi:hypothetical protein
VSSCRSLLVSRSSTRSVRPPRKRQRSHLAKRPSLGNRLAVLLSCSGQNSIQNGVPSSSQILYNMEGLRQESGVVQVLHDHAYRGNAALVFKTYKLAAWILLFLYFVVLMKRDTGSRSRCMKGSRGFGASHIENRLLRTNDLLRKEIETKLSRSCPKNDRPVIKGIVISGGNMRPFLYLRRTYPRRLQKGLRPVQARPSPGRNHRDAQRPVLLATPRCL